MLVAVSLRRKYDHDSGNDSGNDSGLSDVATAMHQLSPPSAPSQSRNRLGALG